MRGTGEQKVERSRSIDRSDSAKISLARGWLRLEGDATHTNNEVRKHTMFCAHLYTWLPRVLLCLVFLLNSGCSLFLDLDSGKSCEAHSDCDASLYCSDLIAGAGGNTAQGCIERDACNAHTDCEGNTFCLSLNNTLDNICVTAACGNGVVEPGETCDGDCPTECWDGTACTQDVLTGTAATCDVVCSSAPLADDSCIADDGCCPSGCSTETDNDCASICGDGFVGPGETCEGEGCPTEASCDDSQACTQDIFSGSTETCNAACSQVEVTACVADDGCCPPGCDFFNDNDCSQIDT